MDIKVKIKSFFSKAMDCVRNSRFYNFDIKERIRIIISSILLSSYLLVSFNILEIGNETGQDAVRVLGTFALVFVAVAFLYIFFIDYKVKEYSNKNIKHLFIVIFSICLVLMLTFYFAGKTIGTSSDIADQFNQAVTGEYNNWHPVAHTFIFYKIPIWLFGESLSSAVLFQYLFMAVITAYFAYSAIKLGIRVHIVVIAIAIMLLNDTFRYIVKFPWKDIPFAFSLLLLTINLVQIYFTDGKWLKKNKNVVFFSLSLLLVLFLRHNGIIAILPTALVLIFAYKNIRTRSIVITASAIALYFVVTIPLYGLLQIKSHPQGFAEAMGVPNNQISYIVKKEGNITEDEKEFVSNVVPVGVIWYHYDIGDFNSIKWRKNQAGTAYYYNGEFIQNNKVEYLKTWFSIVQKNPKLAFEGYYFATRELWVSRLEITNKITYSVGLSFFIATFLIAAAAFRDKKRLVAYIPMLFNMLGIMMLVTGGEIRFVFANLVCGIPLALFALTPKDALDEKYLNMGDIPDEV